MEVRQRRYCQLPHPSGRDLTGNMGKPANQGTLESNTGKTDKGKTRMEDPNGTSIMRGNSCGDLNGKEGTLENEWAPKYGDASS